MRFSHIILPSIASASTLGLGYLLKSSAVDGPSNTTTLGIVIAALAGALSLWHHFVANGGKFTEADVKAAEDAALKKIGAPQPLVDIAEQLAPIVTNEANQLADAVRGYLAKLPSDAAVTGGHQSLVWSVVDFLSNEVAGNSAAEGKIESLRQDLHNQSFPDTVAKAAA